MNGARMPLSPNKRLFAPSHANPWVFTTIAAARPVAHPPRRNAQRNLVQPQGFPSLLSISVVRRKELVALMTLHLQGRRAMDAARTGARGLAARTGAFVQPLFLQVEFGWGDRI